MLRNPDELFVGVIGSVDAKGGGKEIFNLHYDVGTFDFVVICTRFAAGFPETRADKITETTYGVRAFLTRVPTAEPIVRQLILQKFHPARAAVEAAANETAQRSDTRHDDLIVTPREAVVPVRGRSQREQTAKKIDTNIRREKK